MFDVKKLDSIAGYALAIKPNLWMKETTDPDLKNSSETFISIMNEMKDYVCIDLGESELDVIIRREELEKETLIIKVGMYNTGFVIGRKGRNISNVITNIKHKYPDAKTKRIYVSDPLLPRDALHDMNRDFVDYIVKTIKERTVLDAVKDVKENRFIQQNEVDSDISMRYKDIETGLRLYIQTIKVESGRYRADVVVNDRVIPDIVGTTVYEVLSAASTIYSVASSKTFLGNPMFNGNTLVIAKMLSPVKNSFIFHTYLASDGSRWVVGYIVSETDTSIEVCFDNKHSTECSKELVLMA